MPLKNGNTVAVERRVDLASLFCMIGRHGPAVALAVIAMVSVLAALVIYRTVRGKRRKATAEAAAADGDGNRESPAGVEGDESVIRETQDSVESTDVNDEGSSDVKQDVHLIQSDLRIRHRRAAAAEKTPAPYSPPESDIRVPDIEPTASDDTEEAAVAWDSQRAAETYAEEANQNLQSDTCTEAEMVLEDAVDCQRCESDDGIKDVLEEFRDSCLKEPEPINAENHGQEDEVSTAECQEDEGVTPEKDVLDETPGQEDNFQCALNNPVCFQQYMSENGNDEGLSEHQTTNSVESNLEEPVIHIEGVSVPCVCYGKDDDLQPENTDSTDFCSYSGNIRLSPEGESRNETDEVEEHGLDHQVVAHPAEISSSTFQKESNLPSTQHEQCDDDTDKGTSPIQDTDLDEYVGLAGEEIVREDHLNKLTAVKFDAPLAQFEEQDVEIEQKEENGPTCDQEDSALYNGADQAKDKLQTGGKDIVCSEESGSSSEALSPTLTCLSAPVKDDNHDSSLSGISGIADSADLSFDCQLPQKGDNTATSLDEDPISNILEPKMSSCDIENEPENNENGTAVVLAEESDDQVYDPQVQSCYEDQQSIQALRNEAFDEASVAADPDIAANVPSVIVEDISYPHLQSICQDQQIEHVENNETSDETRVDSAPDAATCNKTSCSVLLMSEELSNSDTQSFSQDQQSDLTKNNEDFSEVTDGAAPVMIEDLNPPLCHVYLPSFAQFALMDNDVSLAGVGEESGISSMTVSPDAGNEFDAIFEEMVLPVMDCELRSEGQTEAQNSFFADDAAISVIEKDTAGMLFGPYPSHRWQPPCSERTAWTYYESSATNEDMFGHEIEDSYHSAMDQFAEQIAYSVTNFSEKPSDMKVKVEVVESKEKTNGGSVEKKEATKAEKEIEEDFEKTEISIMEATMDHNEWIMDSNYQAFPWMNLSAPSSAQDDTKTNQLPSEECQYSSASADTTCTDTTDIPPSAEVKQTDTLSLVDENTENNTNVVAVEPMPQNVDVTFCIHYFTQSPYQTVAVTGNQQELGNWKGFVPLERSNDGHWATVVSLPAESHVEWKFVVVDKGEVCRWEECGNRLLDTGSGDDLLVNEWWGRLRELQITGLNLFKPRRLDVSGPANFQRHDHKDKPVI
ncbi:uncharacterized protein stbd1 [Anoplopoma fimbria]|uniref:uncharacterized protein stbd1 n=1 Tax=Anoplopoma fimbria TaxID=229290 RepID=UPI0023EDE4C1|nr:uncharacterized protein stbd1 [Anoplopoma fimbria]